jgi:hypothetical protein
MSTYRIDPLSPNLLQCERCGETVSTIPPCDAPALENLTAQQAALAWPDAAEAIMLHAVLCLWRSSPAPPDGRGVFIHLRERESGQ